MSTRILKNLLKTPLTTIFRGREVKFNAKATQGFDMNDEEESARYFNWLEKYEGLIIDRTSWYEPR